MQFFYMAYRTFLRCRRFLGVFLFLLFALSPFIRFPLSLPLAAQKGANNPVVEKTDYIIRFTVNSGSYSLYKRELGKNRLMPLLNDREPRSTYIAIALNGRVYTLGRNTRYLASKAERLTLLTDGGFFVWKLPQRVSVKYYVRILSESNLTSYIRLNIIVENASAATQSVGLFHMFDIANNNLGLPAFSLPDGDVFRETILEGSQVPYFVQTSYNAYFYFDVGSATRPDRVILANWTKLHEAGWNYGFQLNGQGFGYNLYDSNNPSMGLYYDARPLAARQSRSYVLYLSFDAVPSFRNFSEFRDSPIAEPKELEGNPNLYEDKPIDDGATDTLLSQLIREQRRSNDLLEQLGNAGSLELVENNESQNDQKKPPAEENQDESQSSETNIKLQTTELLPNIDIEALNLLYQSENKRFAQLLSLKESLELTQKFQQSRLFGSNQNSGGRNLGIQNGHFDKNLRAWQLEQMRLLGQLDNWKIYLINILSQLPESVSKQSEMFKFHSNLRDLRVSLEGFSAEWSVLLQRVELTWNAWQNGEVGEPSERISEALYQSQQEFLPYMNELSDLARYSNGIAERIQTSLAPLYGEMSQTLLAVREHIKTVSKIVANIYEKFPIYSEQFENNNQVMLQKTLSRNEQKLENIGWEIEQLQTEFQLVFQNIRLLEQWQRDIERNQSLLAYDPYSKETEVKAQLQKIGQRMDLQSEELQGLQKAQNGLQTSELFSGFVSPGKNIGVAVPHLAVFRRQEPSIFELLGQSADFRRNRHLVQLIQPYGSGDTTQRNKMSDSVRPQIDENELYNALEGFPDQERPPLPNSVSEPGPRKNYVNPPGSPPVQQYFSGRENQNSPVLPSNNAQPGGERWENGVSASPLSPPSGFRSPSVQRRFSGKESQNNPVLPGNNAQPGGERWKNGVSASPLSPPSGFRSPSVQRRFSGKEGQNNPVLPGNNAQPGGENRRESRPGSVNRRGGVSPINPLGLRSPSVQQRFSGKEGQNNPVLPGNNAQPGGENRRESRPGSVNRRGGVSPINPSGLRSPSVQQRFLGKESQNNPVLPGNNAQPGGENRRESRPGSVNRRGGVSPLNPSGFRSPSVQQRFSGKESQNNPVLPGNNAQPGGENRRESRPGSVNRRGSVSPLNPSGFRSPSVQRRFSGKESQNNPVLPGNNAQPGNVNRRGGVSPLNPSGFRSPSVQRRFSGKESQNNPVLPGNNAQPGSVNRRGGVSPLNPSGFRSPSARERESQNNPALPGNKLNGSQRSGRQGSTVVAPLYGGGPGTEEGHSPPSGVASRPADGGNALRQSTIDSAAPGYQNPLQGRRQRSLGPQSSADLEWNQNRTFNPVDPQYRNSLSREPSGVVGRQGAPLEAQQSGPLRPLESSQNNRGFSGPLPGQEQWQGRRKKKEYQQSPHIMTQNPEKQQKTLDPFAPDMSSSEARISEQKAMEQRDLVPLKPRSNLQNELENRNFSTNRQPGNTLRPSADQPALEGDDGPYERYGDIKNFIRNIDDYLNKKNFNEEDVYNSEKRWSDLEKKYNIQK